MLSGIVVESTLGQPYKACNAFLSMPAGRAEEFRDHAMMHFIPNNTFHTDTSAYICLLALSFYYTGHDAGLLDSCSAGAWAAGAA